MNGELFKRLFVIGSFFWLTLSGTATAQQQWHTYFDLYSNWGGSTRWFYQVDLSKMVKRGDWVYGRERWKGNNDAENRDPNGWAFEVNCRKPSVQREGWVRYFKSGSKWMVDGAPVRPLTGGLDPVKALWSFSCERSW
jgi:hypothetical protein